MLLSDIALRRPVGAIVLSILIVLFGVVGYTFLGVREYPAIDPPTISVRTNYTGANAEIIESQVTDAPPTVTKSDANSDPIIFMPIQSSKMNDLELSDYVENVMQEKLQTI